MRTSWIVQTNVDPESTSPALLETACSSLALPFHGIAVTAGSPVLPNLPSIDGAVVFHGRNTLIQRALEHEHWRKGIFFAPGTFTHEAAVAALGSDMLNARARTMTFDELLASNFAPQRQLFIRPDRDSKRFTGKVMRFAECRALYEAVLSAAGDDEPERVVVGDVREIDAEWRLFMVGERVVSGSMYRPSGDRYLPPALIDFAESAARRWLPAEVVVMDVARCDGSWKIIEFNCFNGSRFYLADVQAIVLAVSRHQADRW